MLPETRHFPCVVAALRPISAWIRDRARGACLDDETAYRVDLCLNEAVANIVAHAYGDGKRHEIAITLRGTADTFSVTLHDDGRPFDPLAFPSPVPATSLDDVPVGGWGIHLVRSFADELEYRRADDHNILTLRFWPRKQPV